MRSGDARERKKGRVGNTCNCYLPREAAVLLKQSSCRRRLSTCRGLRCRRSGPVPRTGKDQPISPSSLVLVYRQGCVHLPPSPSLGFGPVGFGGSLDSMRSFGEGKSVVVDELSTVGCSEQLQLQVECTCVLQCGKAPAATSQAATGATSLPGDVISHRL